MTQTEIAKLIAMLIAAFPQSQFSEASSELYESLLEDVELDLGMLAVQRIIATSKWLPAIAEIRTTVAEIKYGPKRMGAEAWGDVSEAVRRVGAWRPPPTFEDPLVAECVRLLGWLSICRGSNEVSDRARFIDLYDGLQERERRDLTSGYRLPAPIPARARPALPVARAALPQSTSATKSITVDELNKELAKVRPLAPVFPGKSDPPK